MNTEFALRRHVSATSSWAVIGLLLAMPGVAVAQTTAPAGAVEAAPTSGQAVEETDADANSISEGDAEEILVVGSRASQQSANARKRNAKTATDSIVADDIGSFPDRNVAEAISRIPGVALGRNEFGEGADVAVRGNGPDLTRVELDGVGLTSTTGLAISNDSARSADLRELPAELIKSVDVVKGSTADQTEGSLGGGIQIKTRSGLDFAKPYFTLRLGGNQNSLGKSWRPDGNFVASRKFFDNRLGAIVSGSYSKLQNNGHSYEQTTSNNRNYARDFDFDNSPEKTFEYNLATLGTDLADVAFANSAETPRTLLTKAAAARTKADCITAFPHLNPLTTTSSAQRAQRILEQQSCLNQWNDATPSFIRHFMNEQNDERYSFDGRLDYQVADNFTVFVKGTYSGRNIHDQNRSRSPVSLIIANPAGSFVNTAVPTATNGAPYPIVRSLSPAAPAGYYYYPGGISSIGIPNNNSIYAIEGNVLNVVPGSVTVDANHNVTQWTTTNNSVSIDQIENQAKSRTKFAQTGFDYQGDRLQVEGFAGLTIAESRREDIRTSRAAFYGDATLTLQDNGLWDIQLPSNFDDSNAAAFVTLNPAPCISGGTNPATCIAQNAISATVNNPASPAYTSAQLPLTSSALQVTYRPRLAETSEKIAKLDATYKTDGILPFITRVKVGGQYRMNEIDSWGNGGYEAKSAVGTFGQAGYQPPIVVPGALVTSTIRACQPTATSSVSCNYGYVPSTNLGAIRSGQQTLTPQELIDLYARTMESPTSDYFGDLPNRGNLPPSWNGIRTDELVAATGIGEYMNFDCLKECVGSDGQVYEQPVFHTEETIKNLYAMAEFEQDLPLGLLFNGNVGVRGVFTSVKADALILLRSIRTTPAFNPLDPNNGAGITTTIFRQNINFKANTTDWLPTANLNLWAFDEQVVLRLYGGKTVARPPVSRLVPGGECNIDERVSLDNNEEDLFSCPVRVGNPELSPFTAWNYNASLEWYPNRDTLLSVTYGKLDVKVGQPMAVTEQRFPFAGTDTVDPATGQPLADLEFSVPTYTDGPGYKRTIWEFQAKTAFTFLPWILRHTGADVNYSRLGSVATEGLQDWRTGDILPPAGESRDYINASVWYDDGKLNMRVAYQDRSASFSCYAPCGGNNVSFNYPGMGNENNNTRLPYNPGVPRFVDATTFIDAKVSYNINRNFQVYLEGRNMTRESQIISTGGYEDFADGAPKVMRLQYGGRRIMAGARIQFGGSN